MNTPLEKGRMYLKVYHGRDHPDEEMSGGGFDGPLIGPVDYVIVTYNAYIKLFKDSLDWLQWYDDMLFFRDRYYGDWAVFVADGTQGEADMFPDDSRVAKPTAEDVEVPVIPS